MTAPLAGVKVLDFTRVLAGPYLTMVLADLGADVIKIENPNGGDDTRSYRPPEKGGESAYFLSVNRNKQSLALDIRTSEGQDICREIARQSDIVVQNFRADVLGRYGLDYESLRAVNPKLIYASISGYGGDGSFRLVAGYDQIAQGEGGLQYLTGDPVGEPVRAGASIADTITGLHTGMAILAALRHADATGQGQHIDMALLDCVTAITSFHAQGALITGDDPPRTGNDSALVVPTSLIPCSDGKINLLVGNDKQFVRLAEDVLDMPELAKDPRFAVNAARRENKPALMAILEAAFSKHTRVEMIERCRANGVPAGSVRTITEAVAGPEVRERGLIQKVEHPTAGSFETVGSPLKLSETPTVPAGPAPVLGADTRRILADQLGYDASKIKALADAGIIPADQES